MKEHDRLEAAYRRRTYYHKAHYSLDRGDGIEYDALFVSMTPCELYERKVTMEQLHAAIAALPDKQAKRIYAYYFLGLTESAIAKSEGVSVASVSESIQRGLGTWRLSLKIVCNAPERKAQSLTVIRRTRYPRDLKIFEN
ncbi:sigma factor-like helix-turn-helix DNA-binding protein [Clostridium sp. OF09-36]|uniref:sigma factor-like helix-turn-helix DNA-binding protein n=1 Tax=Clostridium sp. OF09-36 TaxID=2292310 RepID=UPI00325A6688